MVDDNEFNLLAMSALLNSYFNIKCETALSGKIAMQKIKKKVSGNTCCLHFSLILMDLDMPELNGF